jgi:hypothetical protein
VIYPAPWHVRKYLDTFLLVLHLPHTLIALLQVPPALTVRIGTLVERNTGRPAQLRGTNFFGWNTGSLNFDGLWAYLDDDIPKEDSVSGPARKDVLQLQWWGKRRMTNDFAAVVHRMKLLGLNAVRVQFT